VGNKLTQTDAESRTTSWEYDDLGRVISRTLPLGQSEHFTYDAAGNVLTHTDFKGNTTDFEYDQNNQVVKKTFQDGSVEQFTYTATGRQDTIIDARGTTLNLYDNGDRLIKAVNPDGSSIEYQYDSMGNRTAVIVDTDTTRYTFDDLNRLKTVSDPEGGVTTYTYDPVGNRSSVSYPNGTVAEYTYDTLNRLTELFNHKANGDTVSWYEYTLGPAGNRVKVTEHSGRTVDYTYDYTYKLTEEYIDDPDFGVRVISYEYDQVGNRLLKVDDGDSTLYSYDANDRLLIENEITYTYDDNGNTLTKDDGTVVTNYFYDYQNRLIKVDDGGDVVEYWYDTDGMRVKKAVNGTVTKFLLDKNRNYAQVIEERDNTGSTLVRYTYGDDLLSQKRSSLTSYYHYDGQLSTRQLSDASQNVTDTYTYDAFGVLLNRSGSTENNYLYSGEQYDPNCGFYYLRARYYNASVGCFITMDTFPGMQFEPASLHKYLYCEGNPVGNWDPSGKLNIKSLVEFSVALSVANLILTSIYVGARKLLNWLGEKREPVEWKGNMIIITFSPLTPFTWGLIIASLDGTHNNETTGSINVIVMFGLSLSITRWNGSIPIGGVSLESPGLLGLMTQVLIGPVIWKSVAGAIGIGISKSNFWMGFAKGNCVSPFVVGIETGGEVMNGFSFPGY